MDPEPSIDRGRAWATGSETYDTSLRRYTRQVPPGSADGGLCQTCSSIDFAAIRAIDRATIVTSYSENIGRVYHVFRLPHLRGLENPSCRLCRLLYFYRSLRNKLRNVDQDEDTWTLALRPVYYGERRTQYPYPDFSFLQLVLAIEGSPFRESVPTTWSDLGHDELLWYDTPSATQQSDDDAKGDFVDCAWLKTELDSCQRAHDDRTSGASVPGMKLIDCTNWTIIDATPDKEYVALSYVWSHPASSTGPPAAFSAIIDADGLPPTIRDAMALTLRLGKRYLWVDRFCIDQADHDGKMTQIAAMHEIYGGASTTVVSLMPDDTHPLPGVSTPRLDRCCVRKNSGTLLLRGLLKTEVDRSHWATRAWVFQEAYMSRRVIFVSEARVVLACPKMVLEEVPSHIDPTHQVRMEWAFTHGDGSFSHQPTNVYPWDIGSDDTTFDTQHLRYCRRRLTYETDALNAFRGYLAQCGRPSFWGIPIYPMRGYESPPSCPRLSEPLAGFTVGLMWRRATPGAAPATRPLDNHLDSDQFPSWTWASARPNAHYFEIRGAPRRSIVFTRVSFMDENGTVLLSPDSIIHDPTLALSETTTRHLQLTGPAVRCPSAAALETHVKSAYPAEHFDWRGQRVYDDYIPKAEQGQEQTPAPLALLVFADQLGRAKPTPAGRFYSWTLYWLIVDHQHCDTESNAKGDGQSRWRRIGVITTDLGVCPWHTEPTVYDDAADADGRARSRERVADALAGLPRETVVLG